MVTSDLQVQRFETLYAGTPGGMENPTATGPDQMSPISLSRMLGSCHPRFPLAHTESGIGGGREKVVGKIGPTSWRPSTLDVDASPRWHSIAIGYGARLVGGTPLASPENHVMERPFASNHRLHSHNVIRLVNRLQFERKTEDVHKVGSAKTLVEMLVTFPGRHAGRSLTYSKKTQVYVVVRSGTSIASSGTNLKVNFSS
eukprot:scaffold44_cov339-Pavlova_lutheri.AAC.49